MILGKHNIRLHSVNRASITQQNSSWLDSDDVVIILSSARNLVEGYKTVYLCHLDSYTVTVCNGYLVSSHVVTVQLPTWYLVTDFYIGPMVYVCPM